MPSAAYLLNATTWQGSIADTGDRTKDAVGVGVCWGFRESVFRETSPAPETKPASAAVRTDQEHAWSSRSDRLSSSASGPWQCFPSASSVMRVHLPVKVARNEANVV